MLMTKTNNTQDILTRVVAGKNVTRDELRVVAREHKIPQGKTKEDLLNNVKEFGTGFLAPKTVAVSTKTKPTKTKKVKVKSTRGPGRPKAKPEDLVGYKVKIGLRYAKKDSTVTTEMSEGDVFSKPEADKVVKNLLDAGVIRVWGKKGVRAKLLPRYSTKD